MPLTTKKIENAKADAAPTRLWDSGGLYVEVSPSGGKWWRWKYRFDGKEKRLSFGTFPDVSLGEARDKRDDARKLLKSGTDPSADRKAQKREKLQAAANSFEAVAREWYHKQATHWTPGHAADVLHRLERNLFPTLGDKPIADIDAPMLLDTVRTVESRGAHDLAHRMIGVAGQVFRYAVVCKLCKGDPSRDLRGALTKHTPRHQHAIKQDQLPALLSAIDGYPAVGEKQTALALRLLCLTFVRTGELIGAEWSEFSNLDGEAPTWIIPAERMKAKEQHVVPLSSQAVEILRELRKIAKDSRYILPGRNRDKPISNNTLLFALYRLGYKGKMTGHGFRAVASSMLNETGYRPDVIERQLAHKERDKTRGAYNHAQYLPERRAMMQQWAGMLDQLAKRDGKVVPGKFGKAAA